MEAQRWLLGKFPYLRISRFSNNPKSPYRNDRPHSDGRIIFDFPGPRRV